MKPVILAGLTFILCNCSSESVAESIECTSQTPSASVTQLATRPLPERSGPRVKTSGRVPHVQIEVDAVVEVNRKLFQLAFMLPDLEEPRVCPYPYRWQFTRTSTS